MPQSPIYATRKLNDIHIHNKWPLAREGLPFIIPVFGLTCIFVYFGFWTAALLAGILTVFTTFFFRDPERSHSASENAVLAPADGRVIQIQHIENANNPLEAPAVKISIFMSIFNVHVNRVPVGGRIKHIVYRSGKFFSANLDKASEQNESNRITFLTHDSRKIIVVQIAGLIARRIVCWIKNGDNVQPGQRFGMIRFGSRLEVYLPRGTRITAKLRQKVSAGSTIIAYLP